jgi:hypothetical protein
VTHNEILVVSTTVIAAAMFVWKCRDAGVLPDDRLPQAMPGPVHRKHNG